MTSSQSQPATMAEAAGAVPAPPHRGLPDEIVIWEILVRLPPKALLRCRAVCAAWRRATSTNDFLLAHHGRQPSFPIVYGYEYGGSFHQSLLALDHLAADAQLRRVARFGVCEILVLHASCDGLLALSDSDGLFSICNPATHQYAPLPQIDGFRLWGMYRHSTTGEYRLLLRKWNGLAYYVFALGSVQPPRPIEYPEAEKPRDAPLSVLFRGSLHWFVDQYLSESSASNTVMVFDTAAESFQQMLAPAVSGYAELFEMDGMLGMTLLNENSTTVDIFVMKDYETRAWALQHRIELRAEEISMQARCENYHNPRTVVVMPGDGELLVLVHSENCLHHVDINGKLVASFHVTGGLGPAKLGLKQTLVPHTFFPSLEGYVVNDSLFI